MNKLFLYPILMILSHGLNAAELHGSAGVRHHSINISDTDFSSRTLSGSVGWWVGHGIGIEAGFNLPVSSETKDSVSVELNSLATLGFRLESPPTLHGLSLYFLGGIAAANIEGTFDAQDRTSSRTYTGPFAGFGLAQKINPHFFFTADYVHHTVDRSIDIPSVQIALRHYF